MEAGERDCAGGFHSTSLMKAARNDQPELVEKALECTANNIDAVGSDGLTALMIAAALGHLRVMRALCNAGADLNLVDANGHSALDAAIRSEHAEIAALLCVQPATPCPRAMRTPLRLPARTAGAKRLHLEKRFGRPSTGCRANRSRRTRGHRPCRLG